MVQWEYQTVKLEWFELDVELNKLGAQGWELVLGIGGEFVFKRRLS